MHAHAHTHARLHGTSLSHVHTLPPAPPPRSDRPSQPGSRTGSRPTSRATSPPGSKSNSRAVSPSPLPRTNPAMYKTQSGRWLSAPRAPLRADTPPLPPGHHTLRTLPTASVPSSPLPSLPNSPLPPRCHRHRSAHDSDDGGRRDDYGARPNCGQVGSTHSPPPPLIRPSPGSGVPAATSPLSREREGSRAPLTLDSGASSRPSSASIVPPSPGRSTSGHDDYRDFALSPRDEVLVPPAAAGRAARPEEVHHEELSFVHMNGMSSNDTVLMGAASMEPDNDMVLVGAASMPLESCLPGPPPSDPPSPQGPPGTSSRPSSAHSPLQPEASNSSGRVRVRMQ